MKLCWVSGAALLAAGVIMLVIGHFTPMGITSFGWFAYQPLADEILTPGGSAIVLAPVTVTGWVIVAMGLITLAFLAGGVAARRSRD